MASGFPGYVALEQHKRVQLNDTPPTADYIVLCSLAVVFLILTGETASLPCTKPLGSCRLKSLVILLKHVGTRKHCS